MINLTFTKALIINLTFTKALIINLTFKKTLVINLTFTKALVMNNTNINFQEQKKEIDLKHLFRNSAKDLLILCYFHE